MNLWHLNSENKVISLVLQENREFNFSILLKGITLDTYREFLRWLNPEEEGILSFDYSPNYGYDVKVNSISEATFYVTPNCSDVNNPTYDIELEVGFITKNDWAARWLPSIHTADLIDFSEISNYVNNDMGQNYIEFSDSKYFKKIQSVGQASYYSLVSFIYEGDTITGVTDSDNEITLRADDYSVGYPLRISYNSTSYYFEVAQKYLLTNYNNLPNYYKLNYHITATERCSFSINVDDMDIYKIEFSADGGAFSGTIYTQYGIAIDNNENFKNMIISDVLYLKTKRIKDFLYYNWWKYCFK